MKKTYIAAGLLAAASLLSVSLAVAEGAAEKPVHGEYKDWRVLGVSHRLDKKICAFNFR